MKQLTVKEAIKQGYTLYGFGNREWQSTNDLHDDIFDEIEEDEWGDIFLFEKKSNQPIITTTEISEMLADHISENDADECGREDDCVYKAVDELDFSQTAEMINKELSKHKYWMITDIKLVNN